MTTLDELLGVLASIQRLAAEGRERFDNDARQRWSIERLWIFAGNLAERHIREMAIDDGTEPWSELIGIRNVYAHYIPAAINYDRVWVDTIADTARMASAVRMRSGPTPP